MCSSGFFLLQVDRDLGDLDPFIRTNPDQHLDDMAEREDNVYKAKLAEQAERYDGKCWGKDTFWNVSFLGVDTCTQKVLTDLT